MTRRALPLAFAAALIVLFALTAHFRFAALSNGFTNDQFIHLANAQQMLFGEWPTRDFLDAGMPLMYVASALAQRWMGNTLFAEAVLVAVAFGAAAVLTALAVRELTGSAALGLLAAVLEVTIVPRAYGYPKILMYAAGFLLLQRYVSRPAVGRLAALAAGVVTAFLFRHDHGIYLGAAAMVAAFLAPGAEGSQGGIRRAMTFAGLATLFVAPYLLYVQVYDGLWAYLQKGLEFRDREFGRAEYVWPSFGGGEPLHAVLFYAYWAFPILAAALIFRSRRTGTGSIAAARVLPLVVAAVLVNTTFARPPLNARLPDAVVPFLMIGAWLAAAAWRAPQRWVWRPLTAALVVLVAVSVFAVDRTAEHLERAGLFAPFTDWPQYAARTRARLEAPHDDIVLPTGASRVLVPFYDYVARCTTPEHRVLVAGLIPEVVFFTHRPFAGGQAILPGGYFAAERYQRAVVDTLSRQTAPFVIIPGRRYIDDFDAAFPLVAEYVRGRYGPLATLTDEDEMVDVLIDRGVRATRRDEATGWPCLVPAAT